MLSECASPVAPINPSVEHNRVVIMRFGMTLLPLGCLVGAVVAIGGSSLIEIKIGMHLFRNALNIAKGIWESESATFDLRRQPTPALALTSESGPSRQLLQCSGMSGV